MAVIPDWIRDPCHPHQPHNNVPSARPNPGSNRQALLARPVGNEAQMESDYTALNPLEQAVLWRMLELGTRFRPYDADALQF